MYEDVKNSIDKANEDLKFQGFSECVEDAANSLISYLFPAYISNTKTISIDSVKQKFTQAFLYVYEDKNTVEEKFNAFFEKFPIILKTIICDVDAAYRGDPASKNYDEIILAYPCFKAISAYRVAHELFVLDVPIIPRVITEYAHRITGIDIHPGAIIGRYFFIDHGTGVVIGETSVIGDNVTIYQNVTLGAKSFPHDDEGSLIKGIKRHPNIGSNVVIYAGATILGDINIGDNCVIGGNVWLVDSIPAGTKYLK